MHTVKTSQGSATKQHRRSVSRASACGGGRVPTWRLWHVVQVELGIGPLGHRRMLLDSFAELKAGVGEAGRSARPQSAAVRRPEHSEPTSPDAFANGRLSPLRPGSPLRIAGSASDLRRRERLLRELERAEARAAQRRVCAFAAAEY